MKRILLSVLFIVFCLTAFIGCMKWDYGEMEDFSATGDGLFITNEGNFHYKKGVGILLKDERF